MNETTFDPGALLDVGMDGGGDRWTLVLVRVLRHPPESVWAALTEPDQLSAWAPFTTDRDLGTAGEATLTMIDGDATEDAAATVTTAQRPTLLEYTWGTDLLRWELEPVPDGTRLTLRHTLHDRAMVAMVSAGWHLCLVVAEHLLEGRPIAPIRGQDAMNYGWQGLNDAYAEKLATSDTATSDTA